MRVTVLGCGSSGGVPLIGCGCKVCQSSNPKNKRMRVSLYLEINEIKLLVDTSPDLRQQALQHNLKRVDAVLYTHDHADHTHGLDDLRSFNYLSNAAIPVYGNAETIQGLKQRFPYVFAPKPEKIWYRPALEPKTLPDGSVHTFDLMGIEITAFEQQHNRGKTLGFRIGDFAYSTDASDLPETAFEALTGVKTWVVDCLRYTPTPAHATLEKALEWIGRVKPDRAYLTHMSHDLDYDTLRKELPADVEPAYDGLVLNC